MDTLGSGSDFLRRPPGLNRSDIDVLCISWLEGSGQGILFLSSLCFSTKVSGQGLDCYAESVFRIANSILSSALRHMLQL
ncbi:hypothetical protein POTOM_014770 [Populus tomentosa]|uniref:Uncharacterized protein n=1 Tax=Populus tomentosa TaxID=118781 RepID=A0A8X8A1W0_POPTO|nr:hypothetical protein POTOM_014770 [Populus tomentosa]